MQPLITKTRRRAIPGADRSQSIPLSFAQRGLWLLDQLEPGSSAYNVPVAVRLEGSLDVGALRLALGQISARHEALRTTVAVQDGEPVQQVAPPTPASLELTDLAGAPDGERDGRAMRLVDIWAHEPFQLAAGPLIRTRLIRLGEDVHILVVVMHHIICDGLSIHLLFDELAEHYGGQGSNPPLAVQYADYAAWQRGQQRDEPEIAWWREYLAGAPTALALPTDHARPAVRSGAGATHVFTLPRTVADGAATLARGMRMSPFMVMLSAYGALVGRLTGSNDLLVGTPFSARSQPEVEPLIGFFVNTLPVRVDLSGQPTFAQLLGRVRTSLLDVLAHQQVPFDTLVEALALDRDPSITPLVQTVFTFEPRPLAEPRLAGVEAELLTLQASSAKFDLDFMVVQKADGSGDLEVAINYSTELFEAATIARLADRFHRLLAAAVAVPDTPLASLPLLTDDERSAVVERWSATGVARQSDTLVHELFARQAVATPDATAVALGASSLTYAELDARADRLAHRLQALGTGPDDVVGILLPRSLDLVTAVLGVMKSGAAYLPLDTNHPTGHIGRVLDTAGSGLVVTDTQTSARLRGTDASAVRIDELVLDAGAVVATRSRSRPDNLAYVIFTSGSTGEPKGVGVPHRALANHAQVMRERFALSREDRVLQFANIGFDVAAEELFPTWLAGGCVVMCSDPPAPDALGALLTGGGVTVANLPSSYWQQWVATLDLDRPVPAPALRLLVIGSESVDAATLAGWCRRTTIPVLNAYGLTETTVTSLVHAVREPDGVTVAVGKPIAGVEAYVLDADLEPVAPGVHGELYLGGAGLARGYLGRPDLTAERFLPNPFATVPGARLHRTGDRARWSTDGSIEVLGRMDEQLKVRGYRIEPAEVEAALCRHPEVTQAAVVADGDRRLVGYVVTSEGAGVPADLRDQVAAELPTYLVPNVLVALDAMPLSASGKVDRKRLPMPVAPTVMQAAPARTELERRLVAIWRDVLDIARVGIDDNFFDAGGSSFTLATVHARLCDLLGRRVPMVTLYEYPTIAALAAHLSVDDRRPAASTRAAQPPHAAPPTASAAAARTARLRARRSHSASKRLVTR